MELALVISPGDVSSATRPSRSGKAEYPKRPKGMRETSTASGLWLKTNTRRAITAPRFEMPSAILLPNLSCKYPKSNCETIPAPNIML